jgi:prepilin-type N-terminal cleavage/methylation domain-containing protein
VGKTEHKILFGGSMRSRQQGFSLIELLIVVAIILIIAAIAIPNLVRAKMAANEASAVSSLRTYNTSIVAYSTTYQTLPATGLGQLGPASTPSSTAADLVDNLLGSATPVKSGYSFTYTPGTAQNGIIYSYSIVAVPSNSSTGQRKFFTDQSGVIRETTNGTTPTASSTPIG